MVKRRDIWSSIKLIDPFGALKTCLVDLDDDRQ